MKLAFSSKYMFLKPLKEQKTLKRESLSLFKASSINTSSQKLLRSPMEYSLIKIVAIERRTLVLSSHFSRVSHLIFYVMKHLFKFIVALGVFAMTIGNSFAMEINPIAELVNEAPQQSQPKHTGSYYYVDSTGNAVLAPIAAGSMNCTIIITEFQCLQIIDDVLVRLYANRVFNPITGKWVAINPLFERTVP